MAEAEPTAAEYKTWLDNNPDKVGTPDYVKVKTAHDAAASGTPPLSVGGIDAAPISGIPSASKLSAIRAEDSPNSAANVGQRAVINRFTALPDLGIALANIGSRYGIFPETKLPYVGSAINRALGGQDMPDDAPLWQRAGEGFLTMSPTSLATAPVRTVAATGAGIAGAEAGNAVGQATGIDPQLLAILGGGLASQGRTAATNVGRGTVAALYGGSGKPNAGELLTAADRIDVRPTGATLGGPTVQRLEQTLERRPGTGPRIMAERQRMRGEIGAAADAVPRAAGATMTTPAEIGRATQGTAEAALTSLENRASAGQQALQNQMRGGEAPINVADLDRLMTRLTDPSVSRLESGQFPAVQSRLDTLREMYRPVPEGQQGPPVPEVRQAPFVGWRNSMLTQRQGEAPMVAEAKIPMTQVARDAYRGAAEQEGVPGPTFDRIQERSRLLADQYRPTLEPLTARAQTDYETAYNRGPAAWDTNPQAQQDFTTAANAGGVNPAVTTNILASRFNDLLAKTLHWRNDSATAPIKFADTMRNQMDPATVSGAVGPQGAQILQDVATLSRASHRPTVTGGSSQSLQDIVGGLMNRLVMPGAAGLLAHSQGGGPGAMGAAATLGAAAHQAFGSPIDHIRATMLNSPTAANAMAGRPTQYAPPSMADLVAALRGVQGSTPRGPPQQPDLLPDVNVAPPVSR